MKKKLCSIVLVAAMTASLFTGCGKKEAEPVAETNIEEAIEMEEVAEVVTEEATEETVKEEKTTAEEAEKPEEAETETGKAGKETEENSPEKKDTKESKPADSPAKSSTKESASNKQTTSPESVAEAPANPSTETKSNAGNSSGNSNVSNSSPENTNGTAQSTPAPAPEPTPAPEPEPCKHEMWDLTNGRGYEGVCCFGTIYDKVCRDCGAYLGEQDERTTCHHEYYTEENITATCTTDGYQSGVTCDCGEINEPGYVVPASGHSPGFEEYAGSVEVPDEVNGGTIDKAKYVTKCVECGIVLSERIDY